jgi:hypothetical protein
MIEIYIQGHPIDYNLNKKFYSQDTKSKNVEDSFAVEFLNYSSEFKFVVPELAFLVVKVYNRQPTPENFIG